MNPTLVLTSDLKKNANLKKERRLHFRWQFVKFFNQAEVFRLRECIIFRIPNGLGHFRLGITLKATGSSIERNQVKRQAREEIRQLAPALGSYDYNVVIPKHKKLSYPYPHRLGLCLKSEFSTHLRQSKELKT